jgi:hypothetical protein
MTFPSAPIEAVSSQRSEEIEPKAGITIANSKGQFAPKEIEVFIKNKIPPATVRILSCGSKIKAR